MLDVVTQKAKEKAENAADIDATVKFAFHEGGVVYVDGYNGNAISNEDKDAECTVKVSLDDLSAMLHGELNPMSAFMEGKMQIEGNMGVAMKLQALFS
jgi:putative sterol carrier protein